MTPDEITIAKALPSIVFVPGIRAKSLARDLAAMAIHFPNVKLTARQRAAMLDIAITYRRQLPDEIVALARSLRGEA